MLRVWLLFAGLIGLSSCGPADPQVSNDDVITPSSPIPTSKPTPSDLPSGAIIASNGGDAPAALQYQDHLIRYSPTYVRAERTYSILNTSEQSISIKWVAVNLREDCLAVPMRDHSERYVLSVPSNYSVGEVGDALTLKSGQSVPLELTKGCGQPLRLRVGTYQGEFDLGPHQF